MNETRGKPLKHTIVTYAPTFVKIYCTCFINVIFLSAFYKTCRVKILSNGFYIHYLAKDLVLDLAHYLGSDKFRNSNVLAESFSQEMQNK